MSKRIASAVALLGAASIISGCDIKQPSAGCQVQDADFAAWQAVYTLKTSPDATKCQARWGEALGVFKYVDPETPNSNRLAIRPEGAAALTEYTTEEEDVVARVDNATVATSIAAELAEAPDEKTGLCAATEFAPATVAAREVRNEATNEVLVAAQTVSYAFENVQVYSAPRAPGTQLKGTLKYTDSSTGCQAEYDMLALWPQTACDMEAFENPTEQNKADRCDVGSGINPDFDAVCLPIGHDGDGACVPNPAKGIPSFKE